MTRILLRRIYSLVVPGGVLLLAAALFLRWARPAAVGALLGVLPYAVLVAGVLLGWRFKRTGMVFALLALALAHQALGHFAAGEGTAVGTARMVFHLTALLLPLNLAGFSLLSERGSLAERAGLGLAVIVGQAVVVLALAGLAPAGAAELWEHSFIEGFLAGWTPVSQPALLAFALAMVLLVGRCLVNRGAMDNGFLWATLAAFLGLHAGGTGAAATVYFSTAGLLLAVAVVEASYAMAYRDELTRLPGRRALNEALEQLGRDYTIAMVDVDHFKKFNDTYGHDVGDQVLQMVASRLERVAAGGRAFRYGGEEFSVLFPGKTVEETLPSLEEAREAIGRSKFTLRGPDRRAKKPKKPKPGGSRRQESITVSIGAAEPQGPRVKPAEVIQAADKALYRAKRAGRNQVRT